MRDVGLEVDELEIAILGERQGVGIRLPIIRAELDRTSPQGHAGADHVIENTGDEPILPILRMDVVPDSPECRRASWRGHRSSLLIGVRRGADRVHTRSTTPSAVSRSTVASTSAPTALVWGYASPSRTIRSATEREPSHRRQTVAALSFKRIALLRVGS